MPEPTATSLLGLKYASLLAGFAGGVISLTFVRSLTKGYAALAVFTGSMTAGYVTPLINQYFTLSSEGQNGIAFLLGLTAMNLIPGVLFLSRKFETNPLWLIDRLRGRKDGE